MDFWAQCVNRQYGKKPKICTPNLHPAFWQGAFLFVHLQKLIAMAKKLTYHFYLKDKNSPKPTPINFAVNINGQRRKLGIGESINPLWWDYENECAIESSRQKKAEKALSKRVNKNLNRLRTELDSLFAEYNAIDKLTPNHTQGEDYLFTLLKKAEDIINGQIVVETKEEQEARKTPTQFFNEFIERWSRSPNCRTGIVPNVGTIWNYKNTIRRYTDFIADNELKDTFAVFNEDFQARFDDYLLNDQELSMNSIVASHSQLKTMLRKAYEKGLLRDTSFLHWTSKAISFTHIYLTDEELNKLYSLKLTAKNQKDEKIGKESHIEESCDLFIVSSRTGLRFSDLKHLNSATWDMEKGKETLTIHVKKTNDKLTIPLHWQVIDIYKKYNGSLPCPVDKSKYNKHIRICAKLVGITQVVEVLEWEKGRPVLKAKQKFELISSHTGRRSFATNLYLVCKSPHQVMNLTGHKTEESFKRYICVSQAEMAEVVRKYINLDKNVEAESNETFEKLVRALRQDTRTIDSQKSKIESLEREVESMKVMSEEEKKDLLAKIENQRFAMGLGLTLEQYEEYQRQADVISSIEDAADPAS